MDSQWRFGLVNLNSGRGKEENTVARTGRPGLQ